MNPPVVPMACPACTSRRCVDHCPSGHGCTWWKCQACFSYGLKDKPVFFDARPKDKRK